MVYNLSCTCAMALAIENYADNGPVHKGAKPDFHRDRIIFDFYPGTATYFLINTRQEQTCTSYIHTVLTCMKLWASKDLEFRRFDMTSSSDENVKEASLVSVLYPPALTVACLAEI